MERLHACVETAFQRSGFVQQELQHILLQLLLTPCAIKVRLVSASLNVVL